MTRLLQQVLHNKQEKTILITISDTISAGVLKELYNLILDEEIKSNSTGVEEDERKDKEVS